jgi:hypothetical protein
MHSIRAFARRALLAAILLPAAAYAADWNAGEHEHTEGAGRGPLYNAPNAGIGPSDAAAIQDYYRALAASARCPPGLLPEVAGCVPSAAAEMWVAGQPVPRNVPVEPLPSDLNARLSPMYGFHYVRMGAEVLLVADGSNVIAAGMPIFLR